MIKLLKINKLYVISIIIRKVKEIPRPILSAMYTKYLIDSLSLKRPLTNIIYLILIYLASEMLLYFYDSWNSTRYEPKAREEISNILTSEFLEKISKIPLKHFENSEFLNKSTLAANELVSTYFNILNFSLDVIVSVITMFSLIGIIFVIDKIILIASLVAIILYFYINNLSSKARLSQEKEIIPFERRKRYFSNMLNSYKNIKSSRLYDSENFFINKWKINSKKVIEIINKFSKNFLF
ncbi:MAG: hypothetical protein LBF97_07815, partial [Elusimicrobiota bacterium]|nr:hypothetical protein [Elusimicrobiota bacterium]